MNNLRNRGEKTSDWTFDFHWLKH